MPGQSIPILESAIALIALRLPTAFLLLFFILLLLLAPFPRSVYLAITKMICERTFTFEIALAVAAPELRREKWLLRRDGGVRLHVYSV